MKHIAIHIPEGWEQLTDRQLSRISVLFYKEMRPVLFDVCMLMELMGMRWFHFKRYIRLRWALRSIPISDLKKQYLWVYEVSNRITFLPKYKRLCAPSKFLLDLTIAEFAVVDDLYIRFQKSEVLGERIDIMHHIAAILYVEKGADRGKFKKADLPLRVSAFAKAPPSFLYAMMVTYQGCRNGLEKRYHRVFKSSGGGTNSLGVPQKQYGFGKVILNMSGGKFGNYAETAATPLHTFMEQLNEELTNK